MSNYAIVTDAASTLLRSQCRELDIVILPMRVRVGDQEYSCGAETNGLDMKDFYSKMRDGVSTGTAALNMGNVQDGMRPLLEQGRDVLLIVFTSALSDSFDYTCAAAQEMREAFPARTIEVVDSLCADFGQGLLVCAAAKNRANGMDIHENARWIEQNRLHYCHWFTVDDLRYLRRGGRISATTALVGSALGIKPILHVDNEGRLVSAGKARGRKNALTEIVEKVGDLAIEPSSQTMFLSHGDCPEDAEFVMREIKARYGVKDFVVNYTSPICGAHSGPGTMALFFVGRER